MGVIICDNDSFFHVLLPDNRGVVHQGFFIVVKIFFLEDRIWCNVGLILVGYIGVLVKLFFLNHRSWMKIGNWTMLVCSEVVELLNPVYYRLDPQIWCAWVWGAHLNLANIFPQDSSSRHKSHTQDKFSSESMCHFGHLFFFLFEFLAVLDHVAFFLAVIAGDVGRLPGGEKGFRLRGGGYHCCHSCQVVRFLKSVNL